LPHGSSYQECLKAYKMVQSLMIQFNYA